MRRATEKTFPRTEALSKAYLLSNPILAGDTENALRVVLESLNEWDVDWIAQKHRTYHKARPNRTPNKIILSRPALLQYIVCRQTTAYEIAHETAFLNGQGSLTERTLLLRYVKHLLHESSSRSFYVAIGNCRVLHKYDHATTKRFYAVLDQRDQELLVEGQPDNKTDDEYRRWKMVLVDKLERRFKEFVSVVRGPRNEKRFLPNDQPGAWSQYIGQCLGLLTPWETEHILPPEFAPTKFNITELKCEGRRDKWDSAEENRMHTIIDPECFGRLAKACGAPAPEQQIDIPQFKGIADAAGGGLDDQIGVPPELTFPQVKSILEELDKRAIRRRVAVSEYLSVEVDGMERGWLNTTNSSRIRLDLSSESRQIQVFTTDAEGKLLLASLWLSLIDITTDTGWQSSIALEGGQRLGIDIKPVLNPAGELESLAALVSYEECYPLRILTHYFQQIRDVVSEQFRLDAALNHARLLRGVIYSHRTKLAMLILFLAVTLDLLVPRRNSHLPAIGAHAEIAGKVVDGPSAPPPIQITKRLSPYATVAGDFRPGVAVHRNQLTDPPPAVSTDREQVFRIYDGSTIRKGEFTFSLAYSNYDRYRNNADIVDMPGSFNVGLNDHIELFFKSNLYGGIKVNNSQNPLGFFRPNVSLCTAIPPCTGSASILAPSAPNVGTMAGADVFCPLNNQPFVQFPLIGGSAGSFAQAQGQIGSLFGFPGFNALIPIGTGGRFSDAAALPDLGSPAGNILPGIVLTVPTTFTTAPTYLPDSPFISRLYGESSFTNYVVGGKIRFTGPHNPNGVAIIPFYRWYPDNADEFRGFNQMQRGAGPGGVLLKGDLGLVGFIDGRIHKHGNVSVNISSLLTSDEKPKAMGDVVLLDQPNEFLVGVDFPVNKHFQPLAEVKPTRYLSASTFNSFENNPVEVLGGVKIFPKRWWGFGVAYRRHLNEQDQGHVNPQDFNTQINQLGDVFVPGRGIVIVPGTTRPATTNGFPNGFRFSIDPNGFVVQLFAGHRNARGLPPKPNETPVITSVTASSSSITLPCPPGLTSESCPTTANLVLSLSAVANDPDGDVLVYSWSVTGGKISGDGRNVNWHLTGARPGIYTASVQVADGKHLAVSRSISVTIAYSDDFVKGPIPR